MCHLDDVCERELPHPQRCPEELQATRHRGLLLVGAQVHNLPLLGAHQQTVNRDGAAHIADLHIKGKPATVRVERRLVETVRPRRKKWDPAAALTACLEILERFVGPPQDVDAVHQHLECVVAECRADRDARMRRGINQTNNIAGLLCPVPTISCRHAAGHFATYAYRPTGTSRAIMPGVDCDNTCPGSCKVT